MSAPSLFFLLFCNLGGGRRWDCLRFFSIEVVVGFSAVFLTKIRELPNLFLSEFRLKIPLWRKSFFSNH